jgi:predicted negative regulator of RcsB-dependent stress response
MVTDQEDLVLSPNVTGPNAAEMMPPGAIRIEGGKGYTFPKIGGRSVQGQGGGLVWRIVVAPQEIYLDAVKPKRFDDNGDEPGGGKLVWELQEPGRILNVPDPVTGRILRVVTVNKAKFMSGPPQEFVEFETLLTPVGLVILPKVDDLTVEIKRLNVEVSRPGGLHLMPEKDIRQVMTLRGVENVKTAPGQAQLPEKRIFDFNTWQMGGMDMLDTNRSLLLSTLGGKETPQQVESLITLARMHLANGMWAEAAGFLDFALALQPELEENPEIIALGGVSRALGRVSDLAFEDLNNKQLEKFPEIGYWRAYVLADLQDWQQAGETLPRDIGILAHYPENLTSRIGLVLAEVALRSGKLDEGERILKLVESHGGALVFQQQAAMDYLKGELVRQRGKPDEAVTLWQPLTTGKDAMYRARAGLAITRLQYERKKITAAQAIDSLERLRYAWRGDELEALINYWLGKVYFDTGEYIKALNIMRDAADFSEGTDLGDRIKAEMVETFVKLFTGNDLKKISGPDAAALYDEFSALIPAGDQGNLIAEKLADHLVSKELLGRAIRLLEQQVQRREGVESFRMAAKLAAIELLDDKSVNALATLGKAVDILGKLPEDQRTPERYQEIAMLRARSLSQERRPDQALALLQSLPRTKTANKLRADIAWRAGYWDDAAEALGDVINDQDIPLTRPLSPENTNLIMRRAVALSLASDRIGLANMREKFTDAMAKTDKARVFEVITRARQSGALADRETLMDIVSEVDMFKEFLDNYKAGNKAPAAATAPATPANAPPSAPPASN